MIDVELDNENLSVGDRASFKPILIYQKVEPITPIRLYNKTVLLKKATDQTWLLYNMMHAASIRHARAQRLAPFSQRQWPAALFQPIWLNFSSIDKYFMYLLVSEDPFLCRFAKCCDLRPDSVKPVESEGMCVWCHLAHISVF